MLPLGESPGALCYTLCILMEVPAVGFAIAGRRRFETLRLVVVDRS
jgi:hypothetical protein